MALVCCVNYYGTFICLYILSLLHGYNYAGVYLSLKGVVYANNNAIQITEIGETGSASNTGLQCITDRMPCCATPNRHGEWLFPDGTAVPRLDMATTFYRTRGDDGTVNLNRLNTNVMMPTGLFCCELPDASGVTQRICADIGMHVIHYEGGI